MITIDKSFISRFVDFEWLAKKMDESFSISVNDGNTKIVFGFNGIGKSSFTKCLRDNNTENLRFLDYEQSFSEDKNEIVISPFIKDIQSSLKTISSLKEQLGAIQLSKAQGYAKTKANKGPIFIKNCESSLAGKTEASLKCDNKKYQDFLDRNKEINPKVFFDIVKELDMITTSKDELDKYNDSKYKMFLSESKEFTDFASNKCPVCGSEFDDINSIIDSKIALLGVSESKLIKLMEDKGYEHQASDIDKYLRLCNELKTDADLLNDFVFCGVDSSLHSNLQAAVTNKTTEELKLATLDAQKTAKYTEIKNKEIQFKNDVSKYLKIPASQIQFNDTDKEIRIVLDREPSKYSTGERHILWFLVEMYSFIGSDSSTLVMDDPASSLDLINMYKIGFEIVKSQKLSNKNLLVFTHSADLINIINSQMKGRFGIYYIEEYNGKLFSEVVNYKTDDLANVITIERLKGKNPNLFESLRERESGPDSLENLVYHYNTIENVSSIDSTLTNHKLVNLIDSFTTFTKSDFYSNCFNKIYYLLALRVWLEKKMFELIPESEVTRRSDYLAKYTLQEKIEILRKTSTYGTNLFEENDIMPETIVSKKVMLNQNLHYYSQVQPFAYAMNMSLDDIKNEINELKAMFC